MQFLAVIAVFFSLLPRQEVTVDTVHEQSRDQATFYVERLLQDNQNVFALWSLTQLSKHPETGEYIRRIVHEQGLAGKNPVFQPYSAGGKSFSEQLYDITFKTGHPDLLIALLAETETGQFESVINKYREKFGFPENSPIDYEKLIYAITEKKMLSPDILPADMFSLSHFLVLFDYGVSSGLLDKKYLESFINNWENRKINVKKKSLESYFATLALLVTHYDLYNYSKISELYDPIISYTFFPNSPTKFRAMNILSYSMYAVGAYNISLDITRDYMMPLARYLRNIRFELSVLKSQGVYLDLLGKLQEAKEKNLRFLQLAEEHQIPISKSDLYNNIARLHLQSGDYSNYLEYQTKALEFARQDSNYDHQIRILKNLYVYEKSNQNLELAKYYLDQSRDLATKQGSQSMLARIYLSYGEFYRDMMQDFQRSETYFEKVDSLITPENDYKNYIVLLFERARLEEIRDQNDKSLELYQHIKDLALAREDSPVYLDAVIDEAKLHLAGNNIDKASTLIDSVRSADISVLSFEEIVKLNRIQSELYFRTGIQDKAFALLEPTINQIIERAKNSTDIQSGYWFVKPEYLNIFKLYIDRLIANGQMGTAVETLDRLKTINDAGLYQNPVVKSQFLSEKELNEYRNLTNQIDNLRKQQLSASSEEKLELESQIDRLTAQRSDLDQKITRMAGREMADIRDIQKRLGGKELILHITELKDYYYIATISRRNIAFRKIELTDRVKSMFTESVEQVASGETDLFNLYNIYSELELDRLPGDIRKLIIIPDSYLYQLPVDILPVSEPVSSQSYGQVQYLVEQYTTQYLTTLRDLNGNGSRLKQHSLDYVGFGKSQFKDISSKSLVPLPYAEIEVNNITRELTNLKHLKTVTSKETTEEMFRSLAPKSKIIHLATHSEVSDRDPLFSTIYMSRSGDNNDNDEYNGRIFAYELFEMHLSNEMVMLNSCESGSGSYLQGSGVMGISRALRYAGARSLVLNLWSVNDMMAANFAVQFYKNINTGESKSASLRNAKLHFLKYKNANPTYWGPYMMLGSDEPLVKPHRDTNIIVATSFLMYLISVVGISYMMQIKNNGRKVDR